MNLYHPGRTKTLEIPEVQITSSWLIEWIWSIDEDNGTHEGWSQNWFPKNRKVRTEKKTDPPKIKNLLTIPFLIFQEGRPAQKGRNFEPGPQVVEKNISNFQHNI